MPEGEFIKASYRQSIKIPRTRVQALNNASSQIGGFNILMNSTFKEERFLLFHMLQSYHEAIRWIELHRYVLF